MPTVAAFAGIAAPADKTTEIAAAVTTIRLGENMDGLPAVSDRRVSEQAHTSDQAGNFSISL